MTPSDTNASESIPVITVVNPRTGETLYSVAEPSESEVHAMYDRAQRAFETLRGMTVGQRLAELDKLKQYIIKNREHIARRIVEETGKCVTDAMIMEIFAALDQITYYQKHAEKILSDRRIATPLLMFGKRSKVFYEPMGIVLIISPWNYPFNLSFLPFICAFVAGNPVILKPSKYTPLKGVYEEMVEQSGFLPGAFQVAYASRRTAGLLIEKRPAKIHFTGSVDVGRHIMAQAAQHLIPVELELGGKDPMIVFDDVNIERTVNGAIWGGFANSGQTCTSVERLFVHERIYDAFMQALQEKVSKLRTLESAAGRSDELELDVGCMTADFQIREIEEQIAEAKSRGAQFLCGGARVPNTHILPPTVITDVAPDMKIQYNESFGSVISVMRFRTEDEVVALANDSPYGLSASVWSADLARAERIARRLVTGNVSINNALATQGNPALPFGGLKDSGFGRYRGAEGLHAFSNIKSILIDKQSSRLEAYWYPYSRKKYGLFAQVIDTVFAGGPLALLKTLWLGLQLELHTRKHRL